MQPRLIVAVFGASAALAPATEITPVSERANMIGTILSGVALGILLAKTVSGGVALCLGLANDVLRRRGPGRAGRPYPRPPVSG